MTSQLRLLDRRHFLAGAVSLSALALAGCSSTATAPQQPAQPVFDPFYVSMYGARPNEKHFVPAVDLRYVDPAFYRSVVPDPTGERPGTIYIDTRAHYLYLVRENRQAIRYGVGLGREGFGWSGRGNIQFKREWPTWTPPAAMITREPELEQWRNGQPGGIDNPLGARALYIFQNGRDTLYRIHGTPEPWTIGKNVSSGCVRLINQDIIDLYDRVATGSTLIVA
ncbi:L,D-transpeptidase [Pelagibacterium lacus]|uniref:L,D-transpeptidase n=1 Tax=Pelagibacterium lacus TaxID=2282655 RepID=A0A369W6I2_9HYPH|nr:L,D-transpeptidase [Pelagibacterium lacus]RDE10158.1 L,D-transpeptidase [Pelagibacterium lacus]